MLRDFAAGREPDLVVAGDVAECLLERIDAIRLSDEVRVQRNAHDRARFLAFGVEAVELALDDVAVVARRDPVYAERDGVGYFEREGETGEGAFFYPYHARLGVAGQIA